MLKMSDDINIKALNKQLNNWKERNQEIGDWLLEHGADHPEFEQKCRERRNAQIKIAQLKQRLHYKPIDRPDTVSIPKFNHYDTAN